MLVLRLPKRGRSTSVTSESRRYRSILAHERGLVIKQTWKHFAFTCAVLGRAMSACRSLAQDAGRFLGPRGGDRMARGGGKSCAMLATLTLALSVVPIGLGKAAAA